MKTDPLPRLGVIDALTAGLTQARRRPWLMLIPACIDLALWLAPRFSFASLLRTMFDSALAALRLSYTPDQLAMVEPGFRQWYEGTAQVATRLNMADGITGGWLGAPSVMATAHVTRLSFVSDLIMAPLRLAPGPLPATSVEISTLGGYLLATIGFWLIGQLLVAVYVYLARGSSSTGEKGRRYGLLGLAARLAVFSIFVGIVVNVLELCLYLALAAVEATGSSPLSILALMFGGVVLWLTLWFLLALFFTNEGIVLEGQPILRSLAQSIRLVNGHLGRSLGLIALINLLVYGFRVLWGLIGITPVGVVVAILGNAFLSTSMLLAAFVFFADLRKATVAAAAKAVN